MNLFCLPPADQAFAFEEVAKNVTDESQVQKHSDSINKHTEAASRLCHCSDEMRCLAGEWECSVDVVIGVITSNTNWLDKP